MLINHTPNEKAQSKENSNNGWINPIMSDWNVSQTHHRQSGPQDYDRRSTKRKTKHYLLLSRDRTKQHHYYLGPAQHCQHRPRPPRLHPYFWPHPCQAPHAVHPPEPKEQTPKTMQLPIGPKRSNAWLPNWMSA